MIYPHGNIESIADDVYMVRGSIKMNALLRITRNMALVKEGEDLTLINPIRLDAAREKQLQELGTVRNIVRLGPFHGVDDPYYVEKFGARFWCQSGGEAYAEPAIDVELSTQSELPVSGAQLFEFKQTKQPECALLLGKAGGILFTCDAIQHYGDYSYNNLAAKLLMPRIGFPRTTIVGPYWLKAMTKEGESLEAEFRSLLELQFDKLLSAHGTLIENGAHAAVLKAVDTAFAKTES
jgi:hypothetical protein